jgi:ComF family protein
MSLLDKITSLYAPHVCVGCGKEGAVLCLSCQEKLSPAVRRCYRCHAADINSRTCKSCRRTSPLFRVQALCRYEGAAKDALWQLKFDNARATAGDIARAMVPLFEQIGDQNAIVVHIPTATSRVRMRGYDQAALIARPAARNAKLRHIPLLMRLGQQRQVGLRRSDRLSQLENAYQIKNAALVRGAHIVLVDDVVTTGATLEAAAKILRMAGAKKIEAIVFAQA